MAEHPGLSYNPLFLYGASAWQDPLDACGWERDAWQNPDAKIVYLHSERFVADMVKALQLNAINDFHGFIERSMRC